jgi:hypothetical protein
LTVFAAHKAQAVSMAWLGGIEPSTVRRQRIDVTTLAERDWTLFADWCASLGVRPVPAGPELLRRFLLEVPASPAVARRRLRAIDAAHLALGLAAPSRQLKPPASRFDAELVAATLGCIRVGGWPAGIVGRRDAALVALICAGGLARRQVRGLRAASGQAPRLSPAVEPGACPACALSRWLRVHALAAAAGWRAARGELADIGEFPARDERAHDCAHEIRWPNRSVRWPMFSAIDRHGWVDEAVPLSVRSITTVVAFRLAEGDRRCRSGDTGRLPDDPQDVQAASPSGNRQQGLQARQEAVQRLEELQEMIDEADAYAEAILERLDSGKTIARE